MVLTALLVLSAKSPAQSLDAYKTCVPGGSCRVEVPVAKAPSAPPLPFDEKYGPLVAKIYGGQRSWGGNTSLILGDAENVNLFEFNTLNMTADIPRVLGSGSKWVAATALLAMIHAANASVDDKMTKYLTWWKEDNRTLKHFLQMTSGMVSDGTDNRIDGVQDNDDRKDLSNTQNLAFFSCSLGPQNVSHNECMERVYKRTTPLYPAGKYFMYGTLTFNFVGAAMEVALGKPIDVLVKEYLLDPLKMKGPWTDMIDSDTAAKIPSLGGGLVATNREYAGFLQAMLKKSFLPEHLHDTQEKIELTYEQYSTQNQVFGPYGMGIWGECIQGSYFSGWPTSCQNNQRITHPGCFGYWDWISRRDGYFFSMMPAYTCDESNGWCGRGVKPDNPESCPELTYSQMYRDAVIGNIDDLFVKH